MVEASVLQSFDAPLHVPSIGYSPLSIPSVHLKPLSTGACQESCCLSEAIPGRIRRQADGLATFRTNSAMTALSSSIDGISIINAT